MSFVSTEWGVDGVDGCDGDTSGWAESEDVVATDVLAADVSEVDTSEAGVA